MKYYVKKYQNASESLNKNYPDYVMQHFWNGDKEGFEKAKQEFDSYYGSYLPEIEITATKPTQSKSTNWTSEHNVKEDNKKYEKSHQAESQKIASAVSSTMNDVGNKIGLGMTAALGAGYLAPATMAGWSAFSAAHPFVAAGVDGVLTGHGIYNLFGENGVQKTYKHFKNGEVGKGILSGAVDALDVMGGVGVFNKTRQGITTLKNLTSPDNIGKNFLMPAGDFVLRHPNLSNKIVRVVKPDGKYIKAINQYNLDRARYGGTDVTLNGAFVIPHKVGGMPVSFYNAINEGRYLPAMSFAQKKNYIQNLKNKYADIIENHTLPANKEHILQEALMAKANADSKVLDPESYELYYKYMKAYEDASQRGITTVQASDFDAIAAQYGLTPSDIRGLRYAKKIDPEVLQKEMELSNKVKSKTVDDYMPASIQERPKLILNNKYNDYYGGYYTPEDNTVTLVTKTDMTNNILQNLDAKDHNSIEWSAAHELDHWIQYSLPKVLNAAVYHPMGYPHINQYTRSDFMQDFPSLKYVPYNEWYSSPHEWRSELAGFMRVKNAPKDVSKWDASLRGDFNTFMDRRFRSTAEDVKQHTGQSLGDVTLDMFTKGYKQGGSIHIKEKNKGKFTESAKRAGKSVQEHARDVVNNPKASKLQKKRAQFALNAKKFKHD